MMELCASDAQCQGRHTSLFGASLGIGCAGVDRSLFRLLKLDNNSIAHGTAASSILEDVRLAVGGCAPYIVVGMFLVCWCYKVDSAHANTHANTHTHTNTHLHLTTVCAVRRRRRVEFLHIHKI